MISEAGSSFGRDLRPEADPTDPTAPPPSEKSIPVDISKFRERPEQLCCGGLLRKLLRLVVVGS